MIPPLAGGALALAALLAALWASGWIGAGGALAALLLYGAIAGAVRLGIVAHGGRPFGPANALTLARGVGACVLAALLPAPGESAMWLAAALGGLILAADGIDGALARRSGLASPFGARFDMEIDALAILLLSLLAARHGVGAWIVLSGLLRYAFVAAGWIMPFLAAPLPHSERRRAFCVVQGATLVLALLPVLPPGSRSTVALAGLLAAAVSFGVDVAWLWRRRVRPLVDGAGVAVAAGVLRSLAIYYAIPGRARRLRRLYAPFVKAGGLALDIGAHAGNRVRAWRALGARVVAVEPQPAFAAILARLYGPDRGVVLVTAAVDAVPGSVTLHVSARTPTVSSISPVFMRAAGAAASFAGVRWDRAVTVEATTLDALIAAHGVPDFIKIDVEGAEARVLAGLSRPVPALSFELVPAAKDVASLCIDRLGELGEWRFNWSPGESHRMAWTEWRDAAAVQAWIAALGPDAPSGDLYARSASTS